MPNLLFVKRITAINGRTVNGQTINSDTGAIQTTNPNDGTVLNQFVDDTVSSHRDDDNNPAWPPGYLVGAPNAGLIKPGDEIEYTVYFMNVGAGSAEEVKLCDRIQPFQGLVLDAYGPSNDIQLEVGNNLTDSIPNTLVNLTAANDGGDRAQLLSTGLNIPTSCNISEANTDGTLVLDYTGTTGLPSALTTMSGSTSNSRPHGSYGFYRFVTKVAD